MDASEPPRENTTSKQFTVEILGAVIAFTTLILPILLITNFSGEYDSNSLSSSTSGIIRLKQ